MIKLIILVIFFFTFPLVIVFICKKWSLPRKIGTIGLAYLFGLIIGTAGLIPKGSEGYRHALHLQGDAALNKATLETLISEGKAVPEDIIVNKMAGIQENIYILSLLVAFPLLLFSLSLKRWLRYAKKGFPLNYPGSDCRYCHGNGGIFYLEGCLSGYMEACRYV
jgi:hypothetical protein